MTTYVTADDHEDDLDELAQEIKDVRDNCDLVFKMLWLTIILLGVAQISTLLQLIFGG